MDKKNSNLILTRTCGNCKSFKPNDPPSEMGNCTYEVKFPDSLFARSPGTRKTMSENWGKDCPCFDWKEGDK